jgi:sorbitol-specific phosphotransferase system component IIC
MPVHLIIVTIHFIADFLFQVEWMAKEKWHNIYALLAHTTIYSLIWLPLSAIFLFAYPCDYSLIGYCYDLEKALYFTLITFVCHTATDAYTSRKTHDLFEKKIYYLPPPRMGAFAWIGFDQVLHYAQLFYTYEYLK